MMASLVSLGQTSKEIVSPPQSSVMFELSLGHLVINHLGESTHVSSSSRVMDFGA